jgi:hypothetical protein
MLLADWESKQTPMIASISVGYDAIVLFALHVTFGPVNAKSSSALFGDLEMELATDLASFMPTLIFSRAALPSLDSMALLKSIDQWPFLLLRTFHLEWLERGENHCH